MTTLGALGGPGRRRKESGHGRGLRRAGEPGAAVPEADRPRSAKRRETAKFERRRNEVVGDHLFLGSMIIAAGWRPYRSSSSKVTAWACCLEGPTLGLLGRYVGSLGEATLDGAKEGGIGQARFAVVGLLDAPSRR